MKYISEFRDPVLAHQLAQAIAAAVQPGRTYRFMGFVAVTPMPWLAMACSICCPVASHMIHGPGCPVCVLPIGPHRPGHCRGPTARCDLGQLWRHLVYPLPVKPVC